MKNQLFFHIGIPKAASTFLQENIFPQLSLTYMAKDVDPYDQENVDIIGAERKKNSVLLSNEGLYSPRNQSQFTRKVGSLNDLYENPKIIVVIRNQIDTISSRYTFKTTSSPSINTSGCRKFVDHYLHEEYGRLLFSQSIKFLYDTFKKENVLVLLFEELVRNESEFIGKLFKFFEIEDAPNCSSKPRNVSYKKTKQIYVNLLLNNIAVGPAVFLRNKGVISQKSLNIWRKKYVYNFKKACLPPLMFPFNRSKKFKLPEDINSTISHLYAEDNQRLQKILNEVNLVKLGYPIE